MSFEDRRVCRAFLLNCCPHEIFSGTVSEPLDSFQSIEFCLESRESISVIVQECTNTPYGLIMNEQ